MIVHQLGDYHSNMPPEIGIPMAVVLWVSLAVLFAKAFWFDPWRRKQRNKKL